MFLLFMIISRNGNIVYEKDFVRDKTSDSNRNIRIASILFTQHSITSEITPNYLKKSNELGLKNQGIELIEFDSSKIVIHQTLTKLKFVFFIDGNTTEYECEIMYRKIYDIYTDYIIKNPLKDLDQPFKLESFEEEIKLLFNA